MTRTCLTTITLLVHSALYAQGWQPAGARSMSMANSTVAVSDVWSFHHNPGALALIRKTSAGISYENRYLLKELQTQAMAIAHPLKAGVISAGAQLYGYRLYRTSRIGLGYSLKLTDRISAGVQLNYQRLRIEHYGSRSTVTAEAGLLAKINEKIAIGFSIMNVGRNKLSAFQDDRFSTFMRLGLNYRISDKAIVLVETEKEVQSRLRVKGGMEYEVLNSFFIRAGGACNPIEVAFGFGYQFKTGVKLDMGSAWQQQLGWSPHFGLTYELKSWTHE